MKIITLSKLLNYSKIPKKQKTTAQIWSLDYLVGLMLFIIVLFICVKMVWDAYPSQDYTLAYRDAVYLSDNLLKEGYPKNWTGSDVILPGIAKNNRIDAGKLLQLSNLEYYQAKTLFHVTTDYIFFIHNSTAIINTGQCIYGFNLSVDENCTFNMNATAYNNIVKIDRLAIYDSEVVQLTVYTWN